MRNGDRTIRELVIFNDEEITDERIIERSKQVQKQIDAVRKAREAFEKLDLKLAETPKGTVTRDKRKYRRARWAAMRALVEVSQRIREIEFTDAVRSKPPMFPTGSDVTVIYARDDVRRAHIRPSVRTQMTAIVIATPGMIASHGALARYCCAPPSMLPQLGNGGWMP